MNEIRDSSQQLEKLGVPREDIGLILPLGMTTKIVDKRNIRNVMDMSRQRMCTRAYWEYRELFGDYLNELANYSEEWAEIIPMIMMPKCEMLGYCPEKYGCGKYPKAVEQ
jgi:thymidylate synthase (FAD)